MMHLTNGFENNGGFKITRDPKDFHRIKRNSGFFRNAGKKEWNEKKNVGPKADGWKNKSSET
jgi:hypothetical protein